MVDRDLSLVDLAELAPATDSVGDVGNPHARRRPHQHVAASHRTTPTLAVAALMLTTALLGAVIRRPNSSMSSRWRW